ncbi:MAG: hypothetical protein FWC38_08990, partial [Proteobacteria bacterium]|nr:hypothetical protein [Pseudomonadota bacterium]
VRGQRSEVRGQRSEVRGQRSEVRGQRSEVKGQRSKVRCVASALLAHMPHAHSSIATETFRNRFREGGGSRI